MEAKLTGGESTLAKHRGGNASHLAGWYLPIPQVNYLLANSFNDYLKDLHTQQDVVDYSKHVDKAMEMGLKRWTFMGPCGTPPDFHLTAREKSLPRQIVVLKRGMRHVQNIWKEDVQGGDMCFIVLKMVKIIDGNMDFDFGEGMSSRPLKFDFLNVDHYVPQFVAMSSAYGGLDATDLMFPVEIGSTGEFVRHFGIKYDVGQCNFNSAHSFEHKRARHADGSVVNCTGEEAIDNMTLIMDKPHVLMHIFV